MIHFLPESPELCSELPGPYAEAVSRLASIRQALACVEQFSGDMPSESMAEAKLAAVWPSASPARQRVYDSRSARVASAAAAGLDALAQQQDRGEEINRSALQRLKSELSAGVEAIDQLFSL